MQQIHDRSICLLSAAGASVLGIQDSVASPFRVACPIKGRYGSRSDAAIVEATEQSRCRDRLLRTGALKGDWRSDVLRMVGRGESRVT
jgi:hypothetical protein